MDILIAAHSVAADIVLITSDRAFYNVAHLHPGKTGLNQKKNI
jgi:hypothetical protein